jgi:hypothetical protein
MNVSTAASRVSVCFLLGALIASCSGAGSVSPSPTAAGGKVSEAEAKEALLSRFGPLVYCDPDNYPVARVDEASAAAEHLAEMRADTAVWAVISDRQGFDPSETPSGDELLVAYREWKELSALALVPSGDGWSVDARFGRTGSDASAPPIVTHVVATIASDGTIRVDSQGPSEPPPCPICLARGTMIATPGGDVAVEAIQPGDPVWTRDRRGRRVSAVVDQIGSIAVPVGHEVVHVVLVDGRSLFVSPGHPMTDGRPVATLRPGDEYSGSTVVSADRVVYGGGRTFDLLPSGPTGAYWANGIELGSTLGR